MDNEIDDLWVDEKMTALEPAPEWRPDANRGLAQMYARGRRRGWIWSAAMASAAGVVVLALSASQSCAWGACLLPGNASFLPASVATPREPGSFKISGLASAPITIEIYSDYECPFCAKYFGETVPQLVAQYVETGKVKLIHRDFPLPQHAWARLAARYANAAGELGEYGAAVDRIFRTQDAWRDNGDIDAQLMEVLPPGIMRKVRAMVRDDARLDDTITADLGMAAKDRVNQTPSLVIESKGKRQTLPAPPFGALKSYLDQLLGR